MNPIVIQPKAAALAASILGLSFLALGMQQQGHVREFLGLTAEEKEILSHMSIVYLDDGQGGQTKTIRFTGVNVQIVNGLGETHLINGSGNLIVGYQEPRTSGLVNRRTGSHGICVGRMNNYLSHSYIVCGAFNAVQGQSNVVFGNNNRAAGNWSSVLGGSGNATTDNGCVVCGGDSNTAAQAGSWIGGGFGNTALGSLSSIAGGENNMAQGDRSSLSGGLNRSATGEHDWVAGSLFEDN